MLHWQLTVVGKARINESESVWNMLLAQSPRARGGAWLMRFHLERALVEPGDEVVVFEPYFDHYATSIALAGGRRRVVRLQEPDLRFDVADLEAAVRTIAGSARSIGLIVEGL